MADGWDIRFGREAEAHLREALRSIRALDLTAPMGVLGDEMLDEFKASFANEQSPSGEPWQPLAPRTQAQVYYKRRGPRGGAHIGRAREASPPGWFERRLRVVTSPRSLSVGEQAGPSAFGFQYGDERENQPGRAFVELTPAMEDRAADVLLKYLAGKW